MALQFRVACVSKTSQSVYFSRREQILVTDICLNIDNIYSSFSERAIPDDVDRSVLVKGKAFFPLGGPEASKQRQIWPGDPRVEFPQISVIEEPAE